MSKWKGIKDVDAAGDRKPWFEPGKYRVRIVGVHDRAGRKGDLFFIVEAEVLEIYNTSDEVKMKVGNTYSQVIKWNTDMGPINVKRFVLAANGLDPNDPDNKESVDEDDLDLIVSEEQPLTGTELDLQCDLIKTREGNDFTKYTWYPAQLED